MDSLVAAAARALRAGDPLGALKRIALREDPPALALRGIALAQLGELAPAAQLLRRAARAFGPSESVARARCITAEAEVALAARDLGWPAHALEQALHTFTSRGDHDNARFARLLQIRRLLLLGQLSRAEPALAKVDLQGAPPMLAAIGHLVAFEIAVRRTSTGAARAALQRAGEAAGRANIPALSAEIEHAAHVLNAPAARLLSRGEERAIPLEQVEQTFASGHLVVDACRRSLRSQQKVVALARRPVLFALLRALAESWPGEATREDLVWRAFGARRANDSHRARLRVELGRLRKELRGMAEVRATARGFTLATAGASEVLVLAPPIEGADAEVRALLADGQAWSTSALALALRASQRTVQRALAGLEAAGQVRALGRGRARRWLSPPVTGFTTTLLLPASPAFG